MTLTEDEEIIKEVMKEVKALGETSKANYETLNTNYEELKALVDENATDVLADEKIKKFTTDISVRQEEIDKKVAEAQEKTDERIDSIETMMQRLPRASGDDDQAKKDFADAKMFQLSVASLKKDSSALRQLQDSDVDLEAFNAYRNSFIGLCRNPGGKDMLSDIDKKSLSVGIDPDGGFTVTPAMASAIITKLFEMDPIRELSAGETISTDAIEWLVDFNEAGADWEGETQTSSETSTPKFEKLRIPVHVLAAKPRATQSLLEDSGINIESWLANHIAMKFLRTESATFVDGDGIGKPRGFLTHDNGTNFGEIEQVSMGAAAALTADGLITVKYSLIEQFLNRGTWLMNRSTVAAAMKLKDNDGQYLWKPSLLEGDPSSQLLSLPVRMSTTMPEVAANALSIALADWQQAFIIVDRLGITIQRDPFTIKPFVEFYTRKRVGGGVLNFQAMKIGKVAV